MLDKLRDKLTPLKVSIDRFYEKCEDDPPSDQCIRFSFNKRIKDVTVELHSWLEPEIETLTYTIFWDNGLTHRFMDKEEVAIVRVPRSAEPVDFIEIWDVFTEKRLYKGIMEDIFLSENTKPLIRR